MTAMPLPLGEAVSVLLNIADQCWHSVMFGTLGLIINEIFTLEGFDVARIAKYMRCLFQAVLPLEDTLAIQVLDQAIQVAKEGKEVGLLFYDANRSTSHFFLTDIALTCLSR